MGLDFEFVGPKVLMSPNQKIPGLRNTIKPGPLGLGLPGPGMPNDSTDLNINMINLDQITMIVIIDLQLAS